MSLKDLLNYKLIETENLALSISHLFIIILTLLAVRLFLIVVKKFFTRPSIANKLDPGKSFSIYQIIKYIIWILAIGLILDSVGIKMTLLVAGSAALFVGIGFGLQNIFKDLLSGLMLLFEENLAVNDVI